MAQSLRSRESFLAPKSARTAALCSGLQLTASIVALLCTVYVLDLPQLTTPHVQHPHKYLLHCTDGGTNTAVYSNKELLLCSQFTSEEILSKKGNFEFVHDNAMLSIEYACIWWYYHSGRCTSAWQLAPSLLD